MTLRIIPALMAVGLCMVSCSDYDQPQPAPEQDEHTYSFTAVLPGIDSRLSYQEDPDNPKSNLKMVWDEDDVIRLYPDPSMGDKEPYYEFIANTGAGTSHTVFVHQGYIKNWENWSGKAIYLFPKGDNLDVSHDSEEFLAKAYVQKENGNTEHLKYAEHKLGSDGSKQYTEYWADFIKDSNLKHDHKMTFSHPNTVVYKVMLRGFIFDIPGGSQLRMSGDAWGGEETILTLGSKDDTEPFLHVGEYGKDGYEDKVLTAYIIRQVPDRVDGTIKKGGNLKFELLTYDKFDGTVIPIDPNDAMRNDNPDYGPDYFTNIPWGDEYTWNVTATADIEYRAGDFVVADLTDTSKDYAYPKIAVDLGLPLKWAAFNVGAKKIDGYGKYAVWGHTTLFSSGGSNLPKIYNGEWISGDPEHDAAYSNWGNEWRTPTVKEFLDLAHYAKWLDSGDQETKDAPGRWKDDLELGDRIFHFKSDPIRKMNDVEMVLVKSKVNDKYIYMHLAGYFREDKNMHAQHKAYFNTSNSKNSRPMFMRLYIESSHAGVNKNLYYLGYSNNLDGTVPVDQMAVSVRAVKAVRAVKD